MGRRIKGLREVIGNMKLAQKLLFLYVAVFGMVCLIIFVALQISFNIYDSRLYEKSLQELDFFAKETADELESIEDFTTSLAIDQTLQQQLDQLKEIRYPSFNYSYHGYRLRQYLIGEMMGRKNVKSVIYMDDRGALITAGEATPEWSQEQRERLYEELDQARGAYVEYAPSEGYPYLLGGRAVLKHSNMSMENLGYLLVTCDVKELIGDQEHGLSAPHAMLSVYDGHTVMYQSQEELPVSLPPYGSGQGYEVITSQGQRYFLCYLTSARTGWMYVNLFPYTEIFGGTQIVRYAVFLGLAAVFAVSVMLMRRLSLLVTRPLRRLSQSMEIVETGDFRRARELLPKAPGRDETGLLTQEFSAMLQKIDTLIEEDYKKQIILKDSKYRMLQAQINPHFLYNTLNTLSWLVRADRKEEAGRMIMELGQMLRASLKRESETSVAQDVELVRSYVAIQEFRYRSRAEFVIETRGSLDSWMIPHITLQPLVENAVNYGIEASARFCRVEIQVEERESTIWMQVRDDGPGMSRERLAEVREGRAKPNGHGIGINNIRERLRMLFGEAARFELESEEGQGTAATIEIPKQMEGNHV